jgi:eukaryotic-like serine/threonine-protein kinase
MATNRRASWQTASPYLDTALDLAPEARAAWLAGIRTESPERAALIEYWIATCDALGDDDFLEGEAAVEPARTALVGLQVGAYRLIEPLGHGGMGSVWLAERTDGRYTGRVAVKLLNVSLVGRAGEERFAREGQIVARLAHPQIAHLIDAGASPIGQPYLVLEYVDGQPIDRFCDGRALEVDARVDLFLQVLAPVAHAHANLVVHRDLKPSNVLVTTDGQIKLLDFGIARLLDTGGAPLTRDGDSVLTPAYAAPEQVSAGEVTTATDVYALGVLLYVLLAGRHPLEPGLDQPATLLRAIIDTEPPRMSQRVVDDDPRLSGTPAAMAAARRATPERLRQALTGDLDTIVGKALEKAPADRYATVAALADDLRLYRSHRPIRARAESRVYRLRKLVRRNRVAAALAAILMIALAGGVVGTVSQAARAAAERDFALRQLARAESVNDLNAFLLSDAAPHGRPFTAGDLLTQAEQLLEKQSAGPPDEVTIESLISIGRQYVSQDEDANARRVLARAYDLSKGLPDRSAATRAKAACAYAGALARGDGLARAQVLIAEALAELPADRAFVLDHVFCELRAGEVAREAGESGADIEHMRAASRLTASSGLGSELLKLTVAMELAEAYRNGGRHVEASAAFAAAFEQMTRLGRDRTEKAGTLLNNWGLARYLLGHPQEAEQLFRRAVNIASADAAGASVSPMLLTNLARPVLELGRVDEAIDIASHADEQAGREGDAVVHTQSTLLLATAYRERGDFARAGERLAEFERAQRARGLPTGHVAYAALASEHALLAEAQGDLANAAAAADRAVAIAEASEQGRDVLARSLVRRANLGVVRGHAAQAATDAQRALDLELAKAEPGSLTSVLGRAYLALGRALGTAGDMAGARTALAVALRNLEPSVGADHADTLKARALLAALGRP